MITPPPTSRSSGIEPPAHPHYPHLFSPCTLAGKTLKNRIVHAAISLHFPVHDDVPEGLIDYHRTRAEGGAAMLIAEPVGIAPHQSNQRVPAWNGRMASGLARWAEAVESLDCRLLAQVQDTGRGRHIPGRYASAIAPSALPDDITGSMPRAMSASDIGAFIAHTAESCAQLQRAGFSGVEVSAGHGHLFHQFLSAYSNHREDEWGGDFEGRCRFLVATCEAIRQRCGSGFILGVKLPGDDGIAGSIDEPTAAAIARHLCSRVQPDFLCYAQGSHHRTLEMHLPDGTYPRLPFHAMVRRLAAQTPGIPVMTLGRFTDPAEAEGALAQGDIALAGLGRALITDPAWPRKAAEGRARDIRYCVSCNTCWKVIVTHTPIACDNNPRVGSLRELTPLPLAARPRRVAVVGAGIAGLEAALSAAQRGHAVTVYGASAEPGGKTRLYAALPAAESLSSIYDYQFVEAQKAGVQFKMGHAVSTAQLIATAPEVVVLATGATMSWPPCLPIDLRAQGWLPDLREAMASLAGVRQPQPGTAVVLDMEQTEGTYAAVERLRDLFAHVVVLCPRERIAEDCSLVTRQRVQRRFHERGITVHCLAEPVWSEAFEETATLHWRSVFGGALQPIEDVALFTYATPRVPDSALEQMEPALQAAGITVHRAGDCLTPRGVLEATAEGHLVGSKV
ncbi:MAG: FAD-dependent oxidoreductase [Ottowia sp.]|uniref:oxidoreductase n=1 Tax=unclassified Ottowia TaxID=2645081 RepID=UPI003C2DBC46